MGNMRLINSQWGEKDLKTFRMIPTTADCPYNEAIFDPESGILAVIGKEKKEVFHTVAKLDDNGDPMKAKSQRPSGKPYREERRSLDTFYEYYLEDTKDIKDFVKAFAENASSFNYSQFFKAQESSNQSTAEPTKNRVDSIVA